MNDPQRKPDLPDSDEPAVQILAEKLIGGGRALAHHDGSTWMVSGALPGETVLAEPTRRRAGIVEARTLEVSDCAHPARPDDPCPHSAVCGGCDWPHVDPHRGTDLKRSAAAEAARKFPDLAAMIEAAEIHQSPGGSRLRARLHWDPKTKRLGFFEERSRTVAEIDSCRILSPTLMAALPSITESLAGRCPERVDVDWLEGTDPDLAVAALRPAKGGPKNVDASWVPSRDETGSKVAGFHKLSRSGVARTGWGEKKVRFELPIPLSVPIGSFFQGNRHLLEPLFSKIADLAGSGSEPVFDLHAGVGFLAAAVQSAGDRELNLVEPHYGAAQAAERNLPSARVAVGCTAEEFVANSRKVLPKEALVLTDPPRTGMTKALIADLASWKPRRILMLGCDPATWARDAGFLCEHGYNPVHLELFDLFPFTHHVEIVAMLETA